jgi:hypothetical protein
VLIIWVSCVPPPSGVCRRSHCAAGFDPQHLLPPPPSHAPPDTRGPQNEHPGCSFCGSRLCAVAVSGPPPLSSPFASTHYTRPRVHETHITSTPGARYMGLVCPLPPPPLRHLHRPAIHVSPTVPCAPKHRRPAEWGSVTSHLCCCTLTRVSTFLQRALAMLPLPPMCYFMYDRHADSRLRRYNTVQA